MSESVVSRDIFLFLTLHTQYKMPKASDELSANTSHITLSLKTKKKETLIPLIQLISSATVLTRRAVQEDVLTFGLVKRV